MPKNIVVVGMPRSGTSMVARVFAQAGYFVADKPDEDLRPADHHNPGGYWESHRLVQRNAEVFEAAGYPHDNTWLYDAIAPDFTSAIPEIRPLPGHREFLAAYQQRAPWVWKDPRLCYTLGYWWRILNPETTGVVLVTRDPRSIYQSFLRLKWRDRSPEAEADVVARVQDHLSAARRAIDTQGIPHVVVSYEQCSQEPEIVARSLTGLSEVAVSASSLNFDHRYDHSSTRGKLATAIDLWAGKLPASVRHALKRIAPKSVLSALFPERQDL